MEISKKEVKYILIMAFIAAVVFSFNDWGTGSFDFLEGIKNLIISFILCLIIYSVHAVTQKRIAQYFEFELNFELFQIKKYIKETRKMITLPLGPIITILTTLISNGRFFFILLNSFNVIENKTARVGRHWTSIKEFEEAQIALSGPLSQIALLTLFKILSPISMVFEKGMFIASTICIFNMLPIPKADGSKILFGSRPLYLTSLIFIIVFIVLIFYLTLIQTIILALILSLIAGLRYLYKLNSN